MLTGLASAPNLGHVVYVDQRPRLSNALPKRHRADWDNELHRTKDGFEAVATTLNSAPAALP